MTWIDITIMSVIFISVTYYLYRRIFKKKDACGGCCEGCASKEKNAELKL